ncbi:MAG: hypothetical protein KGD73_13435 [Candidatus Lokiarchaeota archaeon]|nr:hypothetical protein [Candidatus Lokiarchaeota archaeon]
MTKALIAALFFITIIAIVTPVMATGSNRILMIDVMAKGDDLDIAGATTSIIAKIKFDKASGIPLAQVGFHSKIYDESGEKIYSMKGELKDGLIISDSFQFYCEVREVTWINLWMIMGEGKLKTTDINIVIDYRGFTITLPNTGGQYIPVTISMFVSPKGEYVLGENPEVFTWPEGGWATAMIMVGGIPSVGVVTYLTKYMEKVVP